MVSFKCDMYASVPLSCAWLWLIQLISWTRVENSRLKGRALEKVLVFLEGGNTVPLRDLHCLLLPPSLFCPWPALPFWIFRDQSTDLVSESWTLWAPSQKLREHQKHSRLSSCKWLYFGFLWCVHLFLSFRTQRGCFSSKLWMSAAHLLVLFSLAGLLAFYL